jgi:hypothetical protein
MTRNSITNAPSKFDLSIAFFDRPNSEQLGGRRSVMFVIQDPCSSNSPKPINVVINSISWEDGSGESWCFEGYCKTDIGQPKNWTPKVKGWFRTSDRQGWIDIDAPAQNNPSGAGQVKPEFRKFVDDLVAQRGGTR